MVSKVEWKRVLSMTKINRMVIYNGLKVSFFQDGQNIFSGTLEDILNLFPESPYAFQGLIVKFVDDDGIHHTVKLLADEEHKFRCDIFRDSDSHYISEKVRFFEEVISLARMWRLDLSDMVRKDIVNVYKGLCMVYGGLAEA